MPAPSAGSAERPCSDSLGSLALGLIPVTLFKPGVATRPDARRLVITGDYLSIEPYGISFRRDDEAMADLVPASFERMADNSLPRRLYDRWLMCPLPGGQRLNVPISRQLAET